MKNADDITIASNITNNNDVHIGNVLLFDVSKIKKLNVDFRKMEAKSHPPVYISGAEKKKNNSFRFLST